jgi:signal transduction histidine kinase/CheY-like chemotaxis protein
MWRIPRDLASGSNERLLQAMSRQALRPDQYLERIAEIYRSWPGETFDTIELHDGRVFERFTRIQKADDRPAGRVWSFRDITERRRIDEALRDETRVLEMLNHTGTAIASTLDLQQLVQAVTDAATQLSGAEFGAFFYRVAGEGGDAFELFTLSGAPRQSFAQLVGPPATPLFGATLHSRCMVRSDDILLDPRYRSLAPHQGMTPADPPLRSYLAVPVISRGGDTIGGLLLGHPEAGVFNDRTERIVVSVAAQAGIAIDNARLYDDVRRVALEREQLVEAERAARSESERIGRMKDEFLATLSHELRTPLNAMLGWSHILLSGKIKPEDFNRGLEAIARNARAQTRLIEDLLDMNRIVSGKVRLDVQSLDLATVIGAAVESVRPSADAKQIRLVQVLDPRAGPVSGDPNRLQQVVWNLLSNAIKFTPRGGRISVTLARVESCVEATIADNGMGIGAGFLPQVFDRFRQSDSSITRQHGGLGLGLSIVKQLVELHGGTVRAFSAGTGAGASFTVSLPVAAVQPDLAGKAPYPTEPEHGFRGYGARLEGVKILVIDDEPDARHLVEQVLIQCGATVATAGSADEGLAALAERRPDIIISDIGMPGKDGYEFIHQVRRLDIADGGGTPAIALTAFARSEDRTKALLAGYQVHLSKPIAPGELVATIVGLAAVPRVGASAR